MRDKSLADCCVLVTRPHISSDELCNLIEAAGGKAIRFPVLKITARDPKKIKQEFNVLPQPDIAIFVSRNAVEHGLHILSFEGSKLAAIGPSTVAAISKRGQQVDIHPSESFDSESLLNHAAMQHVQDRSILIIRGQSGRELLGKTLALRGANVSYLAVYRREPNKISTKQIAAFNEAWQSKYIHYVIALSVDTIRNLVKQLPPTSHQLLRSSTLVAPSDRVIKIASELLPGITTLLAQGPSATEIIDAIRNHQQLGQIK